METLRCERIIGRSPERAAIAQLIQSVADAGGRTLFLVGEAGIGKSRLTHDAADAARRAGFVVLRGRAVDSPHPAPFRPLTEAMLAVDRQGRLPDPAGLDGFGPALAKVLPHTRSGSDLGAEASLVMIGEALLRLLRLVADDTGCLLVLEDLHWADAETLAVLEYLADNITAERMGCVATLRPEGGRQAWALSDVLARRRSADVVQLEPMTSREIEALVEGCLGDVPVPAVVQTFIQDRCEGIPFFAEELLSGLVSGGALRRTDGGWKVANRLVPKVPLTVRESIRQRAHPPHRLRVLEAAAVLGRRFDARLLPAIVDRPPDEVFAALRAATRVQLIDAEGGTYRFRHALTRDAVLADLPPGQRASIAKRAAAVVERAEPELDGDACLLAADLHEQAGARSRAAELLGRAAQRALRRGALGTAEALLDSALPLAGSDLAARADIERSLLDVLAMAGKTQPAAVIGDTLLRRLAVTDSTPGERAEVQLALARIAIAAGDWQAASLRITDARTEAGDGGSAELVAAIDAVGAHALMGHGREAEGAELAKRCLAVAERLGLGEIACEALEVIGRAVRAADLDAAAQSFERALAIAERDGLSLWRVRALHELATIDLLSSQDRGRIGQARQAAMDSGALATLAVIDLHLSDIRRLQGRLDEALAAVRRCIDLSRTLRLATLPAALTHLAAIHAWRGDEEAVAAALDEATRDHPGHPDVEVGAAEARAELAMYLADHEAALRHLDAAVEASRRHPAAPFPYRGLWALLRTVYDRDGEGARDEVRASPQFGIPWVRAQLGVAEAVALGHCGDGAAAAARLSDALDVISDPDDVEWLHQPRRLVAPAALRDGWGEPIRWLEEAMTFYAGAGQHHVARWCKDVLRTAGVRVRRTLERDAVVPGRLREIGVTVREYEVLHLLVQGMSNREIGEKLFLSPRTVEKHVAGLLEKTRCRTRAELAAFAARQGG